MGDTATKAKDRWARVRRDLAARDREGLTVRDRIRDAQVILRAQSFDRPVVSGGGRGDPTAQAVDARTRTNAADDETRLDAHLAAARRAHDAERWTALDRACGHLERIIAAHSPQKATAKAKRETDQANHTGCASCARTEVAPGVKRWSPPHKPNPTNLKGLLPTAMLLCQWCRYHASTTGVLPDLAELEAHHAGRRVTCGHR